MVNNTVFASRNLDFHFYFKRRIIPLNGHVLPPVIRTLSIQQVFNESSYLKINISFKVPYNM